MRDQALEEWGQATEEVELLALRKQGMTIAIGIGMFVQGLGLMDLPGLRSLKLHCSGDHADV